MLTIWLNETKVFKSFLCIKSREERLLNGFVKESRYNYVEELVSGRLQIRETGGKFTFSFRRQLIQDRLGFTLEFLHMNVLLIFTSTLDTTLVRIARGTQLDLKSNSRCDSDNNKKQFLQKVRPRFSRSLKYFI